MQQNPSPSFIQSVRSYRPTRQQVLRFAISLLLAILLWGWVTQIQNPYDQRTLAGYTMQTGQLPEGLQIVSSLPDARVTVKGARSDVDAIRQSDLTVTANTAGITGPGTFQVDVLVTGAEDVDKVAVSPSTVTIQVDERVTRIVPVRVQATTSSGSPLTTSLDGIQPLVSQVTVSGPKSAVDRVEEAQLPVTVNQQLGAYETSAAPFAVDAEGLRITEVEVLPSSITVRVDVPQSGKSISVIPNITGVPAEGYTIQVRRALPDTILVDGPPDVLADLLFVNTEPVDVTDATQSITAMVGLEDLPDGVTVIDPSDGRVEVRVAIEDTSTSSQTLPELPIEVLGLEAGYTADLSPNSFTIQVSAPFDVLQLMTPSDIIVLVDVTGLGPGTHVLAPEVTLPPGASWSTADVADGLITVVITETPTTASPEASAPPEAATAPGGT